MKIRGRNITIKQLICLTLYYGIAIHLPASTMPVWGGFFKKIRYQLVRRIFKKCGKNINIEKGAVFGSGLDIEIGDYSGIGIKACIPSNTKIGNYVMMGPNCYILKRNHDFSSVDEPMAKQGYMPDLCTVIEDDVWIGRDVTMTPGRHISRGSVIGACCLLCKDFPAYSVIGGNPSKLIRNRK